MDLRLKTLVILAVALSCCSDEAFSQRSRGSGRGGGSSGFRRRVVGRRGTCDPVERAQNGDEVFVKYSGRLGDTGKIFDSNVDFDEPLSFVLGEGRVIDGWERGLVGTCPGEKLELTIPPELGYGEEGAGNGVIPPNAVLIFDVTLERLDKDLNIETVRDGDCSGDQIVRSKDRVHLHYVATLIDGTEFDNSYERGEPLVLPVGQAGISGWDDGVKGACPGEIRRVTVPPAKGYGEKGVEGSVPPNTTIVLEMEILKIEDRVVSFLDQISSGNFRG